MIYNKGNHFKQTVEQRLCKHEKKHKIKRKKYNKKAMAVASPQHLRLFSTMRNEVRVSEIYRIFVLIWTILI